MTDVQPALIKLRELLYRATQDWHHDVSEALLAPLEAEIAQVTAELEATGLTSREIMDMVQAIPSPAL